MTTATAGAVAQCLTDHEHRIVFCDDAYAELLGRARSEILGRHPLDLTHAPDRPLNAIMLKALSSGGRPFSITKRYVRGDSQLIWVTNHVAAVREGVSSPLVCATSMAVDTPVDRSMVFRNITAARRLCATIVTGKQLFGADLISVPAAELLLQLYLAEVEGRSMTGHELAAALDLTEAMAERWLRLLHTRALVETEQGTAPTLAAPFRISTACEQALEGLIAFTGL